MIWNQPIPDFPYFSGVSVIVASWFISPLLVSHGKFRVTTSTQHTHLNVYMRALEPPDARNLHELVTKCT